MITTLNNTHLRAKVETEDHAEGWIKQYNNMTKIAFVVVEGKILKFPYSGLTLKENGAA